MGMRRDGITSLKALLVLSRWSPSVGRSPMTRQVAQEVGMRAMLILWRLPRAGSHT